MSNYFFLIASIILYGVSSLRLYRSISRVIPNSRLKAGEADVRESWDDYFRRTHTTARYQIIAAPEMEKMARDIVDLYPNRFMLHKTTWDKFPDGTDCIQIGGFTPENRISGENVLFLASFHDNGATLSQFSVMITLLSSFISSLTVCLPYYPVGTMERVIIEGQVATAATHTLNYLVTYRHVASPHGL